MDQYGTNIGNFVYGVSQVNVSGAGVFVVTLSAADNNGDGGAYKEFVFYDALAINDARVEVKYGTTTYKSNYSKVNFLPLPLGLAEFKMQVNTLMTSC